VRLTDDLLELSRVESMPLERKYCDLAALIEDVVARFGSQISKASLDIHMDIVRPLSSECDPDEISQVLVNLIDNAIKYTSVHGKVEIRAMEMDGWAVFEISDNGIGILQQDIPRLYERFYRTDKARSRESGGTGLGLAIVKHIVERHNGEVWVRSEYNHGSTFGFAIARDEKIVKRPLKGFDLSDMDSNRVILTQDAVA
jgi:two-component system phosphate regulon sensor histidine kinase PhoR